MPRDVDLGDEHRHVFRQAVVAEDLHDVRDELRLVVEVVPRDLARVVRVMLERQEGELREPSSVLEVAEKAPEPRRFALGVGPRADVLVLARERGAPELQRRVDAVERRRPLQIESRVMLGRHVLPVGLFAELDPR